MTNGIADDVIKSADITLPVNSELFNFIGSVQNSCRCNNLQYHCHCGGIKSSGQRQNSKLRTPQITLNTHTHNTVGG